MYTLPSLQLRTRTYSLQYLEGFIYNWHYYLGWARMRSRRTCALLLLWVSGVAGGGTGQQQPLGQGHWLQLSWDPCWSRHLLLGRKAMTNLDSTLKSRDMTLPAKICLGKAMVFPVVMYACESWTIKKAECWRTDAFELRCWRRLLRDQTSKS